MKVNGEPKLTCKTALSRLRRHRRGGAARELPGRARSRRRARRLHGEAQDREALDHRAPRSRRREEGPLRQSPAELEDFKQFSMCINCMLCYAACPVVANEPEFLGPAAIALGHRYNLDSRDEGAHERNEIFRGEGTRLLLLLRERVQRGLSEERGPGGRRQPGEAQRRDRLGDGPRPAARREVAMARPAHPHAMKPAPARPTRTAPPQLPTSFRMRRPLPRLHALRRDRHRLPAARLRSSCASSGRSARAPPPGTRCSRASRTRSTSSSTRSRCVSACLRRRALLPALPEGAAAAHRARSSRRPRR